MVSDILLAWKSGWRIWGEERKRERKKLGFHFITGANMFSWICEWIQCSVDLVAHCSFYHISVFNSFQHIPIMTAQYLCHLLVTKRKNNRKKQFSIGLSCKNRESVNCQHDGAPHPIISLSVCVSETHCRNTMRRDQVSKERSILLQTEIWILHSHTRVRVRDRLIRIHIHIHGARAQEREWEGNVNVKHSNLCIFVHIFYIFISSFIHVMYVN